MSMACIAAIFGSSHFSLELADAVKLESMTLNAVEAVEMLSCVCF